MSRPVLTGKDIQAMGYEPGPVFSVILKTLRDSRLNDLVENCRRRTSHGSSIISSGDLKNPDSISMISAIVFDQDIL